MAPPSARHFVAARLQEGTLGDELLGGSGFPDPQVSAGRTVREESPSPSASNPGVREGTAGNGTHRAPLRLRPPVRPRRVFDCTPPLPRQVPRRPFPQPPGGCRTDRWYDLPSPSASNPGVCAGTTGSGGIVRRLSILDKLLTKASEFRAPSQHPSLYTYSVLDWTHQSGSPSAARLPLQLRCIDGCPVQVMFPFSHLCCAASFSASTHQQ